MLGKNAMYGEQKLFKKWKQGPLLSDADTGETHVISVTFTVHSVLTAS